MRILIVSTSFMGMAESYKDACDKLGHECYILTHNDGQNSETLIQRCFLHLKRINRHFVEKELSDNVNSFSNAVLDFCDRIKPDIVIDLLGTNLSCECIKHISDGGVYIIKYMLDLVENFPYLKKTLGMYDFVYTYETCDIAQLKEYGAKKVKLLYATYDDNKYYKIDCDKEFDFCFVGKMFTEEQTNRLTIIKSIISAYPKLKFAIYGVMAKPYQIGRFLLWKLFDNGRKFKNVNLSYDKVNELYCKSAICLNINSYQTFETWSSRILEMMASGTLTFTDTSKDIDKYLRDGVVIYDSIEDLKKKINYYRVHTDEATNISLRGQEIAAKYTMKDSIATIINDYIHSV